MCCAGWLPAQVAGRSIPWTLPTVLIESEFLIWNYPCRSYKLDLTAQAREERVRRPLCPSKMAWVL